MKPLFTLEELEGFSFQQLRNIATYLNIPVSGSTKKRELLKEIYEEVNRENNESVQNFPMSVRIERIFRSMKEK